MFKIGDFAKIKVGYVEEMSKDPIFRAMERMGIMADGHIVEIVSKLYDNQYGVHSVTMPIDAQINQKWLEPVSIKEVNNALETGKQDSPFILLVRKFQEFINKKGAV